MVGRLFLVTQVRRSHTEVYIQGLFVLSSLCHQPYLGILASDRAGDRVEAEYRTINRQHTGFCQLPDSAVSLIALRLEDSELGRVAKTAEKQTAEPLVTPRLQLQPNPGDKTFSWHSCSRDIRHLNGPTAGNLAAPSFIIRSAPGSRV